MLQGELDTPIVNKDVAIAHLPCSCWLGQDTNYTVMLLMSQISDALKRGGCWNCRGNGCDVVCVRQAEAALTTLVVQEGR